MQYWSRLSLNVEEDFKDCSLKLIIYWGALQNYLLLIRELENLSEKLIFESIWGLTAVANYKPVSLLADRVTEWLIKGSKNEDWKNNFCSIFVISQLCEIAWRNWPFWPLATEIFLICFTNLIFLILATFSVIFKITVLEVIVMLLEEIKGLYAGFPI